MLHELPPRKEMYNALIERNSKYEGIFVVGVKTTGIFCRPTCPARKPKMQNVDFFSSPKQALDSGYRPCKRCNPLQTIDKTPKWVESILEKVEEEPIEKWSDKEVEAFESRTNRLRRWFKKHHNMTFHDYVRLRRLGKALGQIKHGANTAQVAYGHGYESLSGCREAMKDLIGQPVVKGKDTTIIHLNRVQTPLGPMLAGTTDKALCLLEFVDRRMVKTQLQRLQKKLNCTFVPGSTSVTENVADQLTQYFEGKLKQFSISLKLPGSDFQQNVWRQLQTIPYGRTRSYKEQAQFIGNEKAVRGVARANRDNRIAITIRCHRGIGSDGSLTGYGGGLWRKKYLLKIEQTYVSNVEN